MTVKESAEKILKILYDYYTGQTPDQGLSVEEIFSRLTSQIHDREVDGGLRYLLDKHWIKESVDPKTTFETYRLTSDGIDHYESLNGQMGQKGSSPVIYVHGDFITHGDLKGTLHINYQYDPKDQAQAHSQDHQENIYEAQKEFMNNYNAVTHFIEYIRKFPQKAKLPSDLDIELTEQCDDVESMVRSSTHRVGEDQQRDAVHRLIDYAHKLPDKTSLKEPLKTELTNQCKVIEMLIKT